MRAKTLDKQERNDGDERRGMEAGGNAMEFTSRRRMITAKHTKQNGS